MRKVLPPRSTQDPWGVAGGEKFSFRIYTNQPGGIKPVVEVKQVVYSSPIEYEQSGDNPEVFVWIPANFKTWAETSLGGINGTGIVWDALP